MNDAVFAQDPTDISAAIAEIDAQRLKGPESVQWSLLLDDAFDHGRPRFPDAPGQRNLYACPSLEGLASASPRLIPLSASEECQAYMRRALWHCRGRPMLSFIGSTISALELNAYWEPLHWVDTQDRQKLLLRWADTRVLPTLPGILSNAQWARLSQPIVQWLYVGRDGLLAACAMAPATTTALPPSLALTNDQLGAFIAASQPDAMVDYAMEHLPDALPEGTTALQCYRWAETACELAHASDIEAWADRIALLCAFALTNGKCSDNRKFTQALATRNWVPGQLGEALLALDLLEDGA